MAKAKKGTVTLEPGLEAKLKKFKQIFDTIMEEDLDFNDYVNTVLSIGLDSMVRTVIPEGSEWDMIQTAFENRFEDMCDIVSEMWRKDVQNEKEFKKRIRKGIEGYIH